MAAAATADADVRDGAEGTTVGPVTFRTSPGEANRLTVTSRRSGVVFSDAAQPWPAATASNGPHTRAAAPSSEDIADVHLGDRGDAALVVAVSVNVMGGPGADVLRGSRGPDRLFGGPGPDRLSGRRGADELTGGPGRDRLLGGGGDDLLVDGETDARAARDVYDGGPSGDSRGSDRGDVLGYARRRRPLRIDLGRRRTSTEDRLVGFESLRGGRGNDRLMGDSDENWLEGGGGADLLDGRDGDDIPMGGSGNDRVYGDDGDDVVWGDEGADALFGGSGDDFVISREERGALQADAVSCGTGEDDSARSDGLDLLTAPCRTIVAFSNGLFLQSRPVIDGDSADFMLSCSGEGPDGCKGTISLHHPRGPSARDGALHRPGDETKVVVSVSLDAVAAATLQAGTVVRVDLVSDAPADLEAPGGYQAFMRAGG